MEHCRQQGRKGLRLADGESLPLGGGSFDLVTALDLLEHLEHESKGLDEARGVVSKVGAYYLVPSVFRFLWSDFERFSGHHRRCSNRQLRCKNEESGFEVSTLSCFNTLFFPMVRALSPVNYLAGRWRAFRSDLEMPITRLKSVVARILPLESGLIAAGDLTFSVSLVCLARTSCPQRGVDET